jgi:uncharacterized protein (DUF427 family)
MRPRYGEDPRGRRPARPAVTKAWKAVVMTEQRGRVRVEPSHKRVRIYVGGEVIVDTPDALYVWEGPHYPQYYVPATDVVAGVLTESATSTRSPSRGTATHYDVKAGSREIRDGAWAYLDSPIEELRDHVRFEFGSMDAWFEEDEEITVHPRDPYTRVQILPTSRHVTVSIDGVVVADTHHAMFLHESHLPRRTYIPKVDVRMDLLTPTATRSMCPYKGVASYYSVTTPAGVRDDIVWWYPTPLRESVQITGLLAFYDEHVDVTVDGVAVPRPTTKFS